MLELNKKPFYLQEEAEKWVYKTLENMSVDEKIGQLFCPIGYATDKGYLQNEFIHRHVGGLMFRQADSNALYETYGYLQEQAKIPMLLAANLEAGGTGLLTDGTSFGMPLQVAATNDEQMAYALGDISCAEASSVGCNFAFAPIVDIDLNYHNPITNVRTFGSDQNKVIEYGRQYIKAAKKHQVVTSIKHFPGDGVDERDQHILTSVNSLDKEAWDESFGKVYQELINEGSLAVMAGHIALPSYQEYFSKEEAFKIIPASLSKELLQDLLRKQLGFNGLIITDATPMVGFCAAMEREKAVPLAIEHGCDMFLFNKDLAEDIEYMHKGYKDGLLSQKRLDEAVIRILATKAAIGLPEKAKNKQLLPKKEQLSIVGCDAHTKLAKTCADKAITLVKDTQRILPLSAKKYKRVLLQILGDCDSNIRVYAQFANTLRINGFEVYPYAKEGFDENGSMQVDSVEQFKHKYDLVMYIANIENASNKTTNRINWFTFFGQGNNIPWFVEEVPTLFVSVANPYHLLDVPMIKTYVNCYSNNTHVIEACMDKLLGKSEFKGVNPIDPFCSRKELEY
ncbi:MULTISPECIES: glycoside hydrolase family 3 N-terminal domain-containing protein [unclassified Breznakia]|uniref:glycoside hydrolase family 3 protein n=1 Tax=unclassified Breznakia TaxID=2623764 RepID=UPI0024736D59|nr:MULTISPECIES: glycoside hydrolase family 3 N-terminal domain-containing protein [unclassified Breznakia]MDH6366790.1 beta-N-acetylhexosaminidase [Breznakia sp. PH1-1]MDH6403823.1 beta-N-acetylhexosaminidase [Breznakia sp. PF1-11]MDH6411532.1 beta-N-acetylhexosaminidase [Breznakia sp. PFB1-11]MDH6413896.1 beta-N-acetylhexosaminidase [Breznakia sp. PFB1-14]MDH6416325.1 beta-N-acetylhexosaminidase [Breznakia sp. PFB1-4]